MFRLNLFRSTPHNNALQDALRLAASRQRQGYLLELLQTTVRASLPMLLTTCPVAPLKTHCPHCLL
jgi:hypothetical protein